MLLVSCQRQDAGDVRSPEPEGRVLEHAALEPLGQAGEWIEGDDVRLCDGYLRRREDEDFCEPEIPEEWAPFEFSGQTYCRQPLRGDKDQRAEVR